MPRLTRCPSRRIVTNGNTYHTHIITPMPGDQPGLEGAELDDMVIRGGRAGEAEARHVHQGTGPSM